jgi:PAS domain S-box-containing protein
VEGKIVFANNECLHLMAIVSTEELIGKTGIEFIHPDYQEKVIERMNKVASEGIVLPFMEEKFIRPDGSLVDVEVKAMPIMLERKPAVQLIIRDITQRKQSDEAVRTIENKYQTLFENVKDVFYRTDLAGTILEISPSIKFFTEFHMDEIIGTNLDTLYANPDDRQPMLNELILNGELNDYEINLKTKAGRIKYASINARLITDQHSNPKYIDGSIRDITDRKRVENELIKSEKKYRMLHESMTDGFVYIDMQGFIKDYNESFKQLLGYSEDELSKLTYIDFTPEKWHDFEQKIIDEQISIRGFSDIYEKEYRKKDGTLFPVEIHAFMLKNDADENEGMWAIVRDITERKRVEETLRESEEKFRTIFSESPIGIELYDANGIITNVNKSDLNMFGLTDISDGLGFNIFDGTSLNLKNKGKLLKGESVTYQAIFDFERVKELQQFKTNRCGKTHFEYNITPLLDAERKIIHGYLLQVQDITERKLAEIALIESRQQLLDIIDFLPDATFVIDNEKRVIAWNKTIEVMTGVHKLDIVGKGDHAYAIPFYGNKRNLFMDLIEDNDEELNERYSNINRKGVSLHAEIFAPALFEGKGAFLSVVGAQLFNKSGVLVGGIESIRDVTDRKKADKALQESEELYRTLFERSNDAIFLVDIATGNYLDANRAAEIMTGRSRDELKTLKTYDITPKGAKKRIKSLLNLNDSVEMGEIEYVKPDGSVRTAILSTVLLTKDQVFGIAHDITQRKQAEKEMVKLEKAIYTSGEAIFLTDCEGVFTFINPAFTSLYGFTTDEIVGKTTPRIIKSGVLDMTVYEVFWQTLLEGKEVRGELVNKRKDGTLIEIESSATPIIDEEKKIIGFLGIQRDITERKRSEIALKNSKKELRKFAAHLQNVREEEKIGVAREIHDDLGQILAALKIDLGLFKKKISKDIETLHTEEVLTKFDELSGLVDKTIKTARRIMNGLRPQIIDSLGFVQAGKSYLCEFEERYHINCQFESAILELKINPQQSVALFRILQEALTNIIKHAKASTVKVQLSNEDDKLIMVISDNGIGFNKKNSGRQDSYGMIGMKERVILLEGVLNITSKVGQGTKVRVEIPYIG